MQIRSHVLFKTREINAPESAGFSWKCFRATAEIFVLKLKCSVKYSEKSPAASVS